MELVFGEENDDINPNSAGNWIVARELLALDTGDWGNPHHIVHHCKGLFCCPHGIRESKLKVWAAILVAWFYLRSGYPDH